MFTLTLLSCLAMGQVPPAPGPVPPVPVASPPRVLVITITVDASGAVRVDPGTAIPVSPAPPSGPDIAGAARTYAAGIPAAFRQVASAVRAGQVATAADVVTAIAKARQQAGAPLAQALQAALAGASDDSGALSDRESAARALETAAAALEGR